MPHVIVKHCQEIRTAKVRLAEKIVEDVTTVLNYGEESVSVAFEEVDSQDWAEKGLPARHRSQLGPAIQEARLHAVTPRSS